MNRAEPGWLLLTLAGLAALLGSFLPFYTYTSGVDVTVWSRGLFPTAALVPLLGFAIGVEALFVLFRGHEPRSPFLNFSWEQARMAVGAFMILLVLSYLLQDRAGGSLGLGYLILSLSALATFAGGVMTRRAQLARTPGEQERDQQVTPAFAAVSRAASDLTKNISERGRRYRTRAAERREVRAVAKREAAEKAAVRRAEMKAAADKAAAEKAAADKAAADKAAAEKAAADKAAAEKAAADKPPPTSGGREGRRREGRRRESRRREGRRRRGRRRQSSGREGRRRESRRGRDDRGECR